MDAVRLIVTIADDLNIVNNQDYISGAEQQICVFMRNAHGTEIKIRMRENFHGVCRRYRLAKRHFES
jgi:hypothetical protein